ncbi:Ctf13p NDAI_0H02230 [Naumovozyma dairenensis CBS 421]|uniref:Uncharacterized protein n=1 Tax=Naumovozyma dairenensis (strain ATCC 10597 / BCRC 20456 / CBS 421 / NBRC 0211 / NRRL Y-12639) TaxID=1071378 RepID=G0WF36_NAUDC|nr:hypothetical protein NDAI_0H02230 [Naumovozyma dairenensis CBS 421]CCD26397.1 hypothetical protein NDAI_0H02230 [Naumovozyma dairenensis CBS 421]
MDITRFLELPVTIRKEVYFHLNGSFTHLNQQFTNTSLLSLISSLATPPFHSKNNEQLREKLYPTYAPYLEAFAFNSNLIDQWLSYSSWLRYDAIVIDCMRLNHLYEGSLIGPVDWIFLGGKIKLAYFDKFYLLQVWFSYQEYAKWIMEGGKDGDLILETEYLRFNTECFKPNMMIETYNVMENRKLLGFVSDVFFGEDEIEDDIFEEKDTLQKENNSIDEEISDALNTLESVENGTYKKRKTSSKIPTMSSKLNDKPLTKIIENLHKFKNIRNLFVRGDALYETMINAHGIRQVGRKVKYVVKTRTRTMQLLQLKYPTRFHVADFSRWVNLREVHMSGIEHADLNEFVLPKACKSLTISNSQNIIWWDIMGKISNFLPEKHRFEHSCYPLNASVQTCSSLENCAHRKLTKLKEDSITQDDLVRCRKEIWKIIFPLNYIQLNNVFSISSGTIVVPNAMYENHRIQLFGKSNINELIVI